MEWETVIGLEVHVSLSTQSKLFSGSSTKFGAEPNTQANIFDAALPGTLPVFNKDALRMAVRFGVGIGAEIGKRSVFDRKNYFYPDLPKGYQISQFELPLGTNGHININVDGTKKRVGLTRIHMEEDAGKLIHGENLGSPGKSYVDFNRTGVPLCEVVSEPDMRSAEEARAYLNELKSILEYTEVSDCNMEEGSLRADANISLRPTGSSELGVKTEIKNVNSVRFIMQAIEVEAARQVDVWELGDEVVQETRLFDPNRSETRSMRCGNFFRAPFMHVLYLVKKDWHFVLAWVDRSGSPLAPPSKM